MFLLLARKFRDFPLSLLYGFMMVQLRSMLPFMPPIRTEENKSILCAIRGTFREGEGIFTVSLWSRTVCSLLLSILSCSAPICRKMRRMRHMREAQNRILTHFPPSDTLFFSPPHLETWNLVHCSQVLSPGLLVCPAPALLCIRSASCFFPTKTWLDTLAHFITDPLTSPINTVHPITRIGFTPQVIAWRSQ